MKQPCISVLSLFALPVMGSTSRFSTGTLPKIEVSLASPAIPSSSVSSVIGDIDKSREIYEAAMMDKLDDFKKSALKDAELKIGSVINGFVHSHNSASLATNEGLQEKRVAFTEAVSVKVNVPALASEHTSDLISGIRSVAQSHADVENTMFQKAESDMTTLVDFIISELSASLKARLISGTRNQGFLERVSLQNNAVESLPEQANIKVAASDASFPSSSKLVENLASRQSVAQNLALLKINLMLVDLCNSINAVIKRDLDVVKKHALQ